MVPQVAWQHVMLLAKDYDCVVTVSARKNVNIDVILTTVTLNLGMNSGRSEISYIKCRLFTRSKFLEHEK
jgi:hypothetical protein